MDASKQREEGQQKSLLLVMNTVSTMVIVAAHSQRQIQLWTELYTC